MFATSAFSELPLSTLSGSLFGSGVAEVVALNEQLDNLASLNADVSESPNLSDAAFPIGQYGHGVLEQASISQLRQLGGGFSVGSMSSGPFSGLGDEPVIVSGDLFFANTTVRSSTTDSASLLDAPIGNMEFTRAFSDGATQADLILGDPAFSVSFVAAASGVDVISSIPIYAVSFTDAGSMAVATSSLTTINGVADEFAVISVIVPTNIVGNSTVINSASYTDFNTASVVFSTNVVTSAQTLDQISVRLQWEPVPTAAPTDWTLINTLRKD